MPISSEAARAERPETISKESRVQANPKRPAPDNWGDDIVQSSWKREAALKALVRKLRINEESGCWEWEGSKTVGYGTLKLQEIYGDFKILAHRLSWVAFKGEPINDGLFVCHHCDNPKCFNPDHLFLGTQKQNLLDCSEKSRTMTGDLNGNSKYSRDDIERVKHLLGKGHTGREISSITGVSASHVSRIKRGYTWRVDTATEANMVHGLRKYSDEELAKVAELLVAGNLKVHEIAKVVGVPRTLVSDMKSKKAHKRFLERATK